MERNRMELLPGVFLTLVRRREDEPACFRAALLRQLSREEAALNALLPETLLYGTQRHPDGSLAEALTALLTDSPERFAPWAFTVLSAALVFSE